MSIYLDNAATSFPKPESVYQAVMRTMREVGVSPGRGSHRRSLEASRILFSAREAVARLFSIRDSSRVIFTHSATEALNMAVCGTLSPGDHVITTSMEHNSLLRPLYGMRQQGVELTIVTADGRGSVDPGEIRRALRPNTRMIAVGHVSNVTGTIAPLDSISRVARECGAMFLVDAAQSAGNVPIDVAAVGIDLLATAGHKGLLGPQGTGLLYVGPDVSIRPLLSGGTGSNSSEQIQPADMPEGFEAGTHNLPGIAGLMAGIEYVLEQGVAVIGERERALAGIVSDRLSALAGATVYGPSDRNQRTGVLSFNLTGMDPSSLAFMLDHNYEIAVRPGLHCAPEAHRSLGTFPQGTVRISPGWFTDSNQVAIFCDAIVECLSTNRN